MKQEDRFLDRFCDLAKVCEKWTSAERFGTANEKTLGVMLVTKLHFKPLSFKGMHKRIFISSL